MPAIWHGAAPRAMVGLDDRRQDFGRTETRVHTEWGQAALLL